MVVNKTHKKICVITFNQADLVYRCKFEQNIPEFHYSIWPLFNCAALLGHYYPNYSMTLLSKLFLGFNFRFSGILMIPALILCFVMFSAYHKMYVINPAESMQVEALSDPYGLKIAIVYDAAPDGQVLMYQRWGAKNDSVLTITSISGADISTFGGSIFFPSFCSSDLTLFFSLLVFHPFQMIL